MRELVSRLVESNCKGLFLTGAHFILHILTLDWLIKRISKAGWTLNLLHPFVAGNAQYASKRAFLV